MLLLRIAHSHSLWLFSSISRLGCIIKGRLLLSPPKHRHSMSSQVPDIPVPKAELLDDDVQWKKWKEWKKRKQREEFRQWQEEEVRSGSSPDEGSISVRIAAACCIDSYSTLYSNGLGLRDRRVGEQIVNSMFSPANQPVGLRWTKQSASMTKIK